MSPSERAEVEPVMTTAKAAPRTWKDNADLVAGRGRSNRMGRTWKDNADEFGRAVRGEDTWYMPILVACSVEPQPNAIGRSHSGGSSTPVEGTEKVSYAAFAARAHVSDKTVATYYQGWAKAIEKGAPVPPAADLGPDDVGSFPIPARPFNGPGGYVRTRAGGPNSTEAVLTSITAGTVKLDAGQLTAAVNMASPTVIDALVSDMSDEAFEHLTAAVAAATTQPETPAVITKTGVTPAKKTSPAKLTATEKLLKKVEAERARKWYEDRIASAPPRANPRPDGYKPPIVKALEGDISSLKMWDAVQLDDLAKKLLESVLAYSGPLAPLDEELVVEALGNVAGTMAKIFEAIEAKKGSTVPDSVPDDWH
jgi:hypothetical protein